MAKQISPSSIYQMKQCPKHLLEFEVITSSAAIKELNMSFFYIASFNQSSFQIRRKLPHVISVNTCCNNLYRKE